MAAEVISKTPSQSPRSCKLREWGQEIESEEESSSTEIAIFLQNEDYNYQFQEGTYITVYHISLITSCGY